jgi:hypothetical protein
MPSGYMAMYIFTLGPLTLTDEDARVLSKTSNPTMQVSRVVV